MDYIDSFERAPTTASDIRSEIPRLLDLSDFADANGDIPDMPYTPGIKFPLGEGGRDFLRAVLGVMGCNGRKLQGASVQTLLEFANKYKVWPIAVRIHLERTLDRPCRLHEKFSKRRKRQYQKTIERGSYSSMPRASATRDLAMFAGGCIYANPEKALYALYATGHTSYNELLADTAATRLFISSFAPEREPKMRQPPQPPREWYKSYPPPGGNVSCYPSNER